MMLVMVQYYDNSLLTLGMELLHGQVVVVEVVVVVVVVVQWAEVNHLG